MQKESSSLQLFAIKLLYFVSYAGFASWLSLFYVYLKEENHFSGFEIGVIAALQQVNMMVALPFWGMLADSYGRKRIFSIALAITIVLFGGFYLSHSFWYFVFFILFFTLFYQPLTSLLDSITLDFIEQSPTTTYGEVRLWASIGWAVSTVITGQLIDNTNLYLIFVIAALVLSISWSIVAFLYKPVKTRRNLAALKINTLKKILLIDWRLTVTLVILLFFGFASAPTHMFINIYYIDLGGTYQHIGIAYAVQAMSELPFFFFGKRLIDRFGVKNVLLLTMLVTAVRMVGYGVITDPWVAVAIGATHGIGFGLFMVAAVDYLHRFVPSNLKATGQSFLYVFYFGAGISLGNMFTGWLKDIAGMQEAMIYQGILSALLFLIAVVTVRMPGK